MRCSTIVSYIMRHTVYRRLCNGDIHNNGCIRGSTNNRVHEGVHNEDINFKEGAMSEEEFEAIAQELREVEPIERRIEEATKR